MLKTIEFHQCFATSYADARTKFAAAVAACGGTRISYEHPSERGPAGEALAIDVAHLGDPNGPRQLIVISGTHGQEGYAGSAVQIAWMLAGGPASLPADTGVLMIHGLNPFGFAHDSRTNEANVDLNRNFVDHEAGAPPENPFYAEIHPLIVAERWDRATRHGVETGFAQFREAHGAAVLSDTQMRGQYTHPDGLTYGGRRREWSNLALERIVKTHLGSAQKIGLIDWHTGIGDYGKPVFLCFNEEGGELFERTAAWWGAENVKNVRPFGVPLPKYQGLVFEGLRAFLGNRPMCGAVIEFGTRGADMRRVLQLDLWLRFKAERASASYVQLHEDMRDAFRPVDQRWREAVVDLGIAITAQAVDGLAQW